ncbi:NAD(P)-dependent oxidoreductase, partial [Halorubrum sp. Atlit-9R]
MLMSNITRNLINGMQKHKVQQIAYVASAGIHLELKGISGFLVTFILRKVLADHNRAYELLRNSGLQWTIARPMQLTTGTLTGSYRETNTGIAPAGQ